MPIGIVIKPLLDQFSTGAVWKRTNNGYIYSGYLGDPLTKEDHRLSIEFFRAGRMNSAGRCGPGKMLLGRMLLDDDEPLTSGEATRIVASNYVRSGADQKESEDTTPSEESNSVAPNLANVVTTDTATNSPIKPPEDVPMTDSE